MYNFAVVLIVVLAFLAPRLTARRNTNPGKVFCNDYLYWLNSWCKALRPAIGRGQGGAACDWPRLGSLLNPQATAALIQLSLTHAGRLLTSFNQNEGNCASSGWTMWKSNRSKGKNQDCQRFCRIIIILTTTITPLLSLFSVLGNHFWWTRHRPHRLLHCKYFLVPSLNPRKRCQLYNFAGHLRPAVGEDQRVLQRSFWWKVCAQGCPCRLGARHHGFGQKWTFWTSL